MDASSGLSEFVESLVINNCLKYNFVFCSLANFSADLPAPYKLLKRFGLFCNAAS